MKYAFFKEETFGLRHQMTFVGKELKIYLPKNYLEENSAFANNLGNKIEVLGLFWFEADGKLLELSLPLKIQFEYQRQESFKGKLKPELPSISYDVFILNKGDAFCYDLNHVQKIDDLELVLLRIIDQGKLPETVSYDESISIMINLLLASGTKTKLGVSSSILEILFSELYRNKFNTGEPFRKLLTKSKNATMYDYKMVRMTKLPQLNSIFNSLVGEDTYNQISNMIGRQRSGSVDRPSPLEKLLKY